MPLTWILSWLWYDGCMDEPNPVGRPSKMTPEVIAKLEEMFQIDATIEEACHQAQIDPVTYYRHMKNDQVFCQKMERAQEYPFIAMKKVVVAAADKGDGNLALKWLKNRQAERYMEKSEQNLKVQKDGAAELAAAMLGEKDDTAVE